MNETFKVLAFFIMGFFVQTEVIAEVRKPTLSGYVEIQPGRKLYVEHYEAQPGKATIFLLNGLTYDVRQWDSFRDSLLSAMPGSGLVIYDMKGMGKTLELDGVAAEPIAFQDQVDDLRALSAVLKIEGHKAALGLSYGGAVALNYAAQYPEDFQSIIAVAPFLERLPEQDRMIKTQMRAYRRAFPLDSRSDDELYVRLLGNMIRQTYPFAEPVLMGRSKAIESIIQLVTGALGWEASKIADKLPAKKVHIIGAQKDEFVKWDRLKAFIAEVPKGHLASVLAIGDKTFPLLTPYQKYHKTTELHGALIANWISHILIGNPEIFKGETFTVDEGSSQAHNERTSVDLDHPAPSSAPASLAVEPVVSEAPAKTENLPKVPAKKTWFCESWLVRLFGHR